MRSSIPIILFTVLLLIPLAAAANQTGLPAYNESLHIQNGDCVPLNATVDIASLGWGVPRLVYFHSWTDDYSVGDEDLPTYILPMPNTVSKLSHFYIDPAIFGNKTGYWYQNYRMNGSEPSGNQRMFKVNLTCPAKTNQTVLPVTASRSNKTEPDKLPYLPERKISDILIARGDTASFTRADPVQWWLFGYSTGSYQYDQPAPAGIVTLEPGNMKGLQPGNYHLDLITAGNNGIWEESYNPTYKANKYNATTYQVIQSPFTAKQPIYIGDMDPQTAEVQLKTFVAATIDDKLVSFRVAYQEPEIEIKRLDAITTKDNRTFYNIRGYTNVADGTTITVTIDPDTLNEKTRAIRQFTTKAVGLKNDPGESRQFNILVPIEYAQIFPGPHEFGISTPTGATQRVPFYIYKELTPHYIPPQYVDYTGVSPYVTPQIIVKTEVVHEPGPTVYVTVPVTPAPEVIQAAQDRAAWGVAFMIVGWIAVLLLIFIVGRWLLSVYRRARETHV